MKWQNALSRLHGGETMMEDVGCLSRVNNIHYDAYGGRKSSDWIKKAAFPNTVKSFCWHSGFNANLALSWIPQCDVEKQSISVLIDL